MTSAQQSLPLDIRTARPLWDVATVMAILNRSEDDVVGLIEEGRLPVAFNLASSGARRRLIVLWRTSVWDFRQNGWAPDKETAEVLKDILPSTRPEMRAVEVRAALAVKQFHLRHLIEAGQLRVDKRRVVAGAGPMSSPWVITESVREFLTKRRL